MVDDPLPFYIIYIDDFTLESIHKLYIQPRDRGGGGGGGGLVNKLHIGGLVCKWRKFRQNKV